MSDTIDIQTLTFIIKQLVTEPDKVEIIRLIDEKGVLLTVKVAPNSTDMGIVIGRSGIMANSIKTYMRALGKAHAMNIRIEFLEPDGSQRPQSSTTAPEIAL